MRRVATAVRTEHVQMWRTLKCSRSCEWMCCKPRATSRAMSPPLRTGHSAHVSHGVLPHSTVEACSDRCLAHANVPGLPTQLLAPCGVVKSTLEIAFFKLGHHGHNIPAEVRPK